MAQQQQHQQQSIQPPQQQKLPIAQINQQHPGPQVLQQQHQQQVHQKQQQQQIQQQQQLLQQKQQQQQLQIQQQKPQQQQQQQQASSGRTYTFGTLMPYLEKLVPVEKKAQLNEIYQLMKSNEMKREEFVKRARIIAGESTIMEALRLLNLKKPENSAKSVSVSSESTVVVETLPAAAAAPQPAVMRPQPQALPMVAPMVIPIVGQKKPAEFALSPPQQPAKKMKTGNDPVQSLEQINDLAAMSGVNIREENENLLAGTREETRAPPIEVRRRLMEEEGKFFLERGPLHSKVQEIAARAGLKIISEDVEKCLSMSAEDWLWTVLVKSIKNSKQRCGLEKGPKIAFVSDLTKPIQAIKKEQKEVRQRKEAEEAERVRKMNEDKGASADDGLTKAQRAAQQQLQDEKRRTDAANNAARRAMGVDDISSRWMFLAQQQQKQALKEQEAGANKTQGGAMAPRPSAKRTMLPSPSSRPAPRTVNLRDVVNCLEREPRVSKSTLLYKLYEKLPTPHAED